MLWGWLLGETVAWSVGEEVTKASLCVSWQRRRQRTLISIWNPWAVQPSFKLFEGIKGSWVLFASLCPQDMRKRAWVMWKPSISQWDQLYLPLLRRPLSFISCKLKICRYPELEHAEIWLAQGRTDRSVLMTDCDIGAFLTRNMVTVALAPAVAVAAKGCGLQTPTSSYEPTLSQRAPQDDCVICCGENCSWWM